MPQFALLIGGLLTVLGIGGYLLGFVLGNEYASPTALIPAGVGIVILICGLIGLRNESARRHAMHAAVAVALLGAISSLIPLFTRILNPEVDTHWLTQLSVIGMLVLCIVLVVARIKSFMQARRSRTMGTEGRAA